MAVANPVQSLQEEATCSVCLEYYTDPVTTDCGHNFCRPCITKCWERDDAGFSCPQCRHVFPQKILRPNRQLINIVTLVQQLPQPSVRPQEESLCDKHNEKLMLFCREDQKVICLVCKESRDHRTHTIQPIEEAAQEYKLTCLNWLDPLKKEMENITKCMSVLKSTAKALRNNLETERQKIIAEFEHLRQLLNKQERILRGQLEEVERKITATETENLSKLSAEFSSLKSLIEEIEEKCKQKDGDFLKDVRSTLRRCEGNKRKRSFSSNVGAHTKQARIEPNDSEIALGNVPLKNLVDRMKTYKVFVRLDPRTANPHLILSMDWRHVRSGDTKQKLPDNPGRFTTSLCVLGREGFTSGRHYWEVEVVKGGGYWSVGVAKESVRRKGWITPLPEEGIWAVERWDGQYRALTSPVTHLSLLERPRKIGVYLNYDGGQISFYNTDTAEHLYTLTHSFTQKMLPYLCIVSGELSLV